jgi:hypothetical protein
MAAPTLTRITSATASRHLAAPSGGVAGSFVIPDNLWALWREWVAPPGLASARHGPHDCRDAPPSESEKEGGGENAELASAGRGHGGAAAREPPGEVHHGVGATRRARLLAAQDVLTWLRGNEMVIDANLVACG